MGIVTLLSDFGTADGYVGEMKGVLASLAPHATIVDVSHDLPPHDVEYARLTVARYWRRFPPGTVHVAVVDPGVGTDRRGLAIESDGRFLVGPDNGVLSPALLLPGVQVVALTVPAGSAPTFHGRDVFAPAAAHLANGGAVAGLGDPVENPVVMRTPEAQRAPDGSVVGRVIAVDRFGNLITNLLLSRGASATLAISGHSIELSRTYAEVDVGEPVAVVGSSGLVEIAVREGSARELMKVERGEPVVLRKGRP